MSFNTISVIGLGYIGLPTAAVFASQKINVVGVDVNAKTVDTINRGEIHIVEPGLEAAVRDAVKSGYLQATTKPVASDAFLIAVPTPFKEDHKPDLSYIEAATKSIAPVIKKGDLVILESTSPVGTTEKVSAWLSKLRPDLSLPHSAGDAADINVAHCPERVLPGNIMKELIENDRIIGGITPKCTSRSVELYKLWVSGECVETNARTAEMAKLTENSFRDVNIAFANELSMICDKLDINVWELIQLANHHPRVNILQPGPGVGGHCIAVDPWFIVNSAPQESKLIHAARLVNDSKPEFVLKKILVEIEGIENPCIACLGLTYKENVNDLRESPALEIVTKLASQTGCKTLVVEPNIEALPRELREHDNVTLVSLKKALVDSDVIVPLVNHNEFRGQLDSDQYKTRILGVVIN